MISHSVPKDDSLTFTSFLPRFLRQQPRMDDIAGRARPSLGNRRIAELRQVRAGPSLPDGQLHAGGVAGRRALQEGDPD